MFSPRFLLLILGKFSETFNANAVKRFVLDLYLANSIYINRADKALYAVESLPRKFALRSILRDALLSYLPALVRHVEKHVHVYSGSAIRGDGHFKLASRILPKERINVVYGWIGIDGACSAHQQQWQERRGQTSGHTWKSWWLTSSAIGRKRVCRGRLAALHSTPPIPMASIA